MSWTVIDIKFRPQSSRGELWCASRHKPFHISLTQQKRSWREMSNQNIINYVINMGEECGWRLERWRCPGQLPPCCVGWTSQRGERENSHEPRKLKITFFWRLPALNQPLWWDLLGLYNLLTPRGNFQEGVMSLGRTWRCKCI